MSLTSRMLQKAFVLADSQKNKGQVTPESIIRFDDIAYGPDKKWNVLDVYRPRDVQGKLPVIIDVHGGGWVYGDKEVYQYYCMALARRGFAVVNFTYRLAPEFIFPSTWKIPILWCASCCPMPKSMALTWTMYSWSETLPELTW